jgi:HK97 family phage major capsid protein
MNKLEQLRARLAAAHAKAKGIVDAADKDNNGTMTDAQQADFDASMADVESIKGQIDRHVKLGDLERDMNASNGRQTAPNANIPRVTGGEPNNPDRDTTAGFGDLADFATAVRGACMRGGRVDERLNAMNMDIQGAPTNFHRETGSSDGYMVPPAMRDQIWELVFGDSDLSGLVDAEDTSASQVQLLADESTPWGSTGIKAYWEAEGAQFDKSRLATKARDVKLHKLAALVLASEELLEDAPRLNSRLLKGASQAISWKVTESIIYGTGAGQPLGYFTSGALVSVAKESGQAADTVNATNVSKMYSRLLSTGIGNAFWLVNQDVLPQLMAMTISNQPIWTPPNAGFAQAPGGFLLGRPIKFHEQAKTVGDKGDIQLIDPKGYYLARRSGGVKYASSIHLYFDYDVQAFRWTFRVGGQPYLSAPVSPKNGSATRSHFVTLDERA